MTGTIPERSPWHRGEIELQRHAGVVDRMDAVGRRVIRELLIDQHREFYPLLPFVVLGAVDKRGEVWATLKCGHPGFLRSPDIHTLSVAAGRDESDPAESGLDDGDAIAILGIELHTRRRNRLNGTISRSSPERFDIKVGQAFGNCPQYIQLRDFTFVRQPSSPGPNAAEEINGLDATASEMISNADTFFVATYMDTPSSGRQVDVSHRGGKPGFVRIGDNGSLAIPDFAGNQFFNTLGNIALNKKAGLLFVDFNTGDLLQITGDADIILDSDEISTFQGAERLWTFTPHKIIRRQAALPLRWQMQDTPWSQNALLTGSWAESEKRQQVKSLAKSWHPYRVVDIIDESSTIRSFHLAPADGAGLIPYAAGQHLPIRLTLPGDNQPVTRNYSISSAPSDDFLRISVKRDGRVSTHLHDTLQTGDIIEARGPAGAFTCDPSKTRPTVMLAAGIGITPLLSMLRHLVYEGKRTRQTRPAWLFHAARYKRERAFDAEIAELVDAAQGAIKWVRVLSDITDARAGADYDYAGRIDIYLLRAILPFDEYDFHVCGPTPFMQSVYDGLLSMNIADNRIHAEAFGPSGIVRMLSGETSFDIDPPPADEPVDIAFPEASVETIWQPGSGSLLDCAEAAGLSPPFSCRTGTCGTCRADLKSGAVTYTQPTTAPIENGDVLLCSAAPARGSGPLKLVF